MGLPFEAGKGTIEQLLNVRSPIYMRVGFPGLLAAGVLYPGVEWLLRPLPTESEYLWERVAVFVAVAFLLGGIISIFSDQAYKLYEGRMGWPGWLEAWATARQDGRLAKLKTEMGDARARGDTNRYNELWAELRVYPLDAEGEPEVQRPTRVGNILAGYEQYPNKRYGMDSVFYWPRIWLMVEKDKKEEIDGQWSLADGFLTMSAVALAGGALWIGAAVVHWLGLVGGDVVPFGGGSRMLAGALGWWVLAWLLYRVSLPFHRENGEIFKSLFDMYRAKVWEMTKLKPGEKEAWDAAWNYLQYWRVVCPVCDRTTPVPEETCRTCGNDLRPQLRRLQESGKLKPG
jgi:hypothetical protein